MILLPGIDSGLALETVEKIRTLIEGRKARDLNEITCSIGLSNFVKEEDRELHQMVERATSALDQASSQGKNSIRVA